MLHSPLRENCHHKPQTETLFCAVPSSVWHSTHKHAFGRPTTSTCSSGQVRPSKRLVTCATEACRWGNHVAKSHAPFPLCSGQKRNKAREWEKGLYVQTRVPGPQAVTFANEGNHQQDQKLAGRERHCRDLGKSRGMTSGKGGQPGGCSEPWPGWITTVWR